MIFIYITLTNISAVSENGVVIASFGPPITNLKFNRYCIALTLFRIYYFFSVLIL